MVDVSRFISSRKEVTMIEQYISVRKAVAKQLLSEGVCQNRHILFFCLNLSVL